MDAGGPMVAKRPAEGIDSTPLDLHPGLVRETYPTRLDAVASALGRVAWQDGNEVLSNLSMNTLSAGDWVRDEIEYDSSSGGSPGPFIDAVFGEPDLDWLDSARTGSAIQGPLAD
jgi:hypothetical protein